MAEIEWNQDGFFNLNKLLGKKKPQSLFLKKEFMIRVVKIANNSASVEGKFLEFEDMIKSSKGRKSITWCHKDVLDVALAHSRVGKTTSQSPQLVPPSKEEDLPVECYFQKPAHIPQKEKKKEEPKKRKSKKKVVLPPLDLAEWDKPVYSGLSVPPSPSPFQLPVPSQQMGQRKQRDLGLGVKMPLGW